MPACCVLRASNVKLGELTFNLGLPSLSILNDLKSEVTKPLYTLPSPLYLNSFMPCLD